MNDWKLTTQQSTIFKCANDWKLFCTVFNNISAGLCIIKSGPVFEAGAQCTISHRTWWPLNPQYNFSHYNLFWIPIGVDKLKHKDIEHMTRNRCGTLTLGRSPSGVTSPKPLTGSGGPGGCTTGWVCGSCTGAHVDARCGMQCSQNCRCSRSPENIKMWRYRRNMRNICHFLQTNAP